MKKLLIKSGMLAAAIVANLVAPAQAAIVISEVAPWSSGNSTLAADWFEVTNTGAAAVGISGWKMDDNSNSFASSVALNGISSIGAGESVIFIESAASPAAAFKTLWFGASAPAGLQIGTYTGSGVGLSTAGDAVNLFNGAGVLQANVVFGASSAAAPFRTFDNAAGLNNSTISLLSVVGVNGAFAAVSAPTNEIGSPGRIAPVPVPAAAWLLGSALTGLVAVRRRRSV